MNTLGAEARHSVREDQRVHPCSSFALKREGSLFFFDASGVARDEQTYANRYAWFFEMREGKVREASAFFDSVTFNDLWRRVTPTP